MSRPPLALTRVAEDGRRLFGRVWPATTKPWGVLGVVHGLGEHIGRYGRFASFFQESGVTVLGFDQRGHGQTGGRLPSFQTLAADVDLVIAELADCGDVPRFLYGQSLGGGLVVHSLLRKEQQVLGAISSAPLLVPAFEPPAWKLRLAKWLYRAWPSFSLASGVRAADLSRDPEAVRRYLADPLVHRRVSAVLGHTMLEAGRWSLANADRLNRPLLLMHGTEDRITSCEASREFANKSQDWCTLMLWDGLFHDLHDEPERLDVLASVIDWMRKLCG